VTVLRGRKGNLPFEDLKNFHFCETRAEIKNSIFKKGKCRLSSSKGHAVAQKLVAYFPQPQPWFELRSNHVGFVVDKVTLWYFSFPFREFN
jgi:hypothetical protein